MPVDPRTAAEQFALAGFDATTMREIADAAGLALGSAYYYFPTKESIVLAYYEETQREHSRRARAAYEKTNDPRARLAAAFHTKLDVLAKDRKLLSALFRTIADPSAQASIFGKQTKTLREESIAIFTEAVAESAAVLDPDTQRVLSLALFSLHMGVMLFFIHDTSKGQQKTRVLVDRSLDMVVNLLPMAPMLAPIVGNGVASILSEAGLLDAGYRGRVILPIVDAPAAKAAQEAGVGGKIRVALGGTIDPARFPPVELDVEVERLGNGEYRHEVSRMPAHAGPTAVLEIGQHVVVVTSRPVSHFDRALFLGIGVLIAQDREAQFQSALASRDAIGQAKGMLMERFGVDAVRAFELMRHLSQESNTPIVTIAARIITTGPDH